MVLGVPIFKHFRRAAVLECGGERWGRDADCKYCIMISTNNFQSNGYFELRQ